QAGRRGGCDGRGLREGGPRGATPEWSEPAVVRRRRRTARATRRQATARPAIRADGHSDPIQPPNTTTLEFPILASPTMDHSGATVWRETDRSPTSCYELGKIPCRRRSDPCQPESSPDPELHCRAK